jgi:uncharacterized protein YPO0396
VSLLLSRIFLHNWHRFRHHSLEVDRCLYLAGHNGSGKSSVLDALQVVLVADLGRVRFNSSAQERSKRDLDSYVRGKLGENRWLRPGNTVAYLALEFTDPAGGDGLVAGTVIEAGPDRTTERTAFLLSGPLDPTRFFDGDRPLTRRELKQHLGKRRTERAFDTIGEYQAELCNRLGGFAPDRFVDLFLRALTFQPIPNIRTFVEQWLLDAKPLDVANLRAVVERLERLQREAERVQAQMTALAGIIGLQGQLASTLTQLRQGRLAEAQVQVWRLDEAIAAAAAQNADRQQQLAVSEEGLAVVRAGLMQTESRLTAAQVSLAQDPVMQRRQALTDELARLRDRLHEVRDRWQRVRTSLQPAVAAIGAALAAPGGWSAAEQSVLQDFQTLMAGDLSLMPPPLPAVLPRLLAVADAALERTERAYHERRLAADGVEQQLQGAQRRYQQLKSGAKPYPQAGERLRDRLEPVLGYRPKLLAEMIDVPDERWQDAVEALLAGRRYNIIVPPEAFDRCLLVLEQARREGISGVGLVDLGKAATESRPAQPQSLALQVATVDPLVRAYVDTLLGDVITCETVATLKRHRRAVTPEVVVYQEWTARAIPQPHFQPWVIGSRALASQLQACEREIQARQAERDALQPQVAALAGRKQDLSLLTRLPQDTVRDEELDERPLRQIVAEQAAALAGLDLSHLDQLQAEIVVLQTLRVTQRQDEATLIERKGALQNQLEEGRRTVETLTADRLEAWTRFDAVCRQHPDDTEAGCALASDWRDAGPDLATVLRRVADTLKQLVGKEGKQRNELATQVERFNVVHHFGGKPEPDDGRFRSEHDRLAATELPRYQQDIANAQQEADVELREHVLHQLRENLMSAEQQFDQLNAALSGIDFDGERYRFECQPNDHQRRYYHLIQEAELVGNTSLTASGHYREHQVDYDAFFRQLIEQPQSEQDRREQERLTDYRYYLDFDILVTDKTGDKSRLSKILASRSGGETQTPFYVTIAASFVQLYRIGPRTGRPSIRLIVFDEAFNKMDQERIGATLDLFRRFGLQIVAATPLERCEYLVPRMETNLVLTAVGDHVLVEPYANYALTLETDDARL